MIQFAVDGLLLLFGSNWPGVDRQPDQESL